MSKTPISIVQEYCAQTQMAPEYELVISGMNSHNPLFRYKLTVLTSQGDVVTYGDGRSKKEAKHNAARRAILELNIKTDLQTSATVLAYQETTIVNYVGKLQTLCADESLPDPKFITIGEEGPSHSRKFTLLCNVANFKEIASSTTKQQAKHDVAKKMINRIETVIKSGEKIEVELTTSRDFEIDKKVIDSYLAVKAKMRMMNNKLGNTIDDYHLADITDAYKFSEEYIQLLKSYDKLSVDPVELLKKHFKDDIRIVYTDSQDGKMKISFCQILCSLNFTTMGCGLNINSSITDAAHKMVCTLKSFLN